MFEGKEGKLAVEIMLVILAITVALSFTRSMIKQSNSIAKYKNEEQAEYTKMFATRNKDYEDQTQEDSTQIILEFSDDKSKDANLAIMNYISNVNGQLLSINEKSVPHNTMTPVVGGMYGKNSGLGLGIGFGSSTTITTKNVYVLLVPKDAKFADDLQERMDRYLKYKNIK